jgi:ATP-dependent helicase/nuclease subunit A
MTQPAAYECNGAPIAPEAFYAIACDPRRSVAVEACAGAGKTWMLVSRMLRALLEDADKAGADGALQPHEILAITFTKRAAGEMRERLYEWLGEFAHADRARLLHELQIRGVPGLQDEATVTRLTAQLKGLYARLLASGRSVQICTFHGWFAALLRSAPVAVLQDLGLPVNYELLEDDSQARALVWRRFYQALLDAPELKADFEAVVLAYGRSQSEKALQAALDKRVEFALADAAGTIDLSVQSFGQQYPEFADLQQPHEALTSAPGRQLLVDAATALGRASAPTFSAKGVELERALTEGDVDAVFPALLTAEGKPRKFGEKIVGIALVRQAQDLVLAVAAARHQHEAWLYQQRTGRLTRLLIAEFTALKRERGWIDMNDVERAALVMLGDTVLSGWVQEKLDARVRHLLIDEFQDTNPLQWQALLAWLGSYSGAGQAPSVFMVGDPKQSIYRFRRAEPQVFKAAQDFVRRGLGGDLLSCDHTRRNAQTVMATVNAAMVQAAANDGYEGFRAHSTDSPHVGVVGRLPPIPRAKAGQAEGQDETSNEGESAGWRDSLLEAREVPEETLRTLEARQAAAWIAQQLAPAGADAAAAGLTPGQIMVLSRKRAGLLPLQQALRALNIPAQIGEKTALIDCCEVQDIVALLDVLVSPQHDLSLARALRSPLFGASDAALVQLALAQRRLAKPWYALLQDDALAPLEELRVIAAHSLQGAAVQLARWKHWLDTLPPHDALQALYDDGDVLARFAAAAPPAQREAVLANLRALLAVALQVDGGRYTTPYALVRALKAGGIQAPATVSADAVRLLTIHGAKGLEAEAVLLLDTDTPPRNADSMGVLVDWPGEAAAPERFVFLVSESRPPACCVQALETEQKARHREELNALYVALTRARRTLAMSSIEPHRSAPGSWWQRLHALAAEWPAPVSADELPAADAASPAGQGLFNFATLPTAPVLAPAAARPASDSAASRTGQAMHRLLEWGALSERHVRAITREFRLDAAQAQTALAGAQRILAGAGAWAWDSAVVSWQGNEVELAYGGQSLRLDRLVQRRDAGHEGHWWVLDYKSNAAPHELPELRLQMQVYRDAVQAVYPAQTVKAAFLTAQGQLLELA